LENRKWKIVVRKNVQFLFTLNKFLKIPGLKAGAMDSLLTPFYIAPAEVNYFLFTIYHFLFSIPAPPYSIIPSSGTKGLCFTTTFVFQLPFK
jgi:hypothetical protein